MQRQKQSLFSKRGQVAAVGLTLWLLLALWSIAAFWQHIDTLGVTYPVITKLGACASEVALLAFVLWHSFSAHIRVRHWSAIFAFGLGACVLIHAGALRGMGEARATQLDTEARVKAGLSDMSREQMQHTKNRAAVAANAQKEFADTVRAGDEKVIQSSILPEWYLRGWMYSLLFVLSLGCVSIVGSMLRNKEDIDSDFNGVPDRLERQEENLFPHELPK